MWIQHEHANCVIDRVKSRRASGGERVREGSKSTSKSTGKSTSKTTVAGKKSVDSVSLHLRFAWQFPTTY